MSRFKRLATLSGHKLMPATLRVSRSGTTLVSTCADKTVRVWDCATWKIRQVIADVDPDARGAIDACDLSPDGRYLCTGCPDLTTKVYATETGERLARLHALKKSSFNSAEVIRFAPADGCLACAKGKVVEIYSTHDFAKVGELQGHTSKVHLLEFSPDGKTLISCGGKQVKIWDRASLTERATLNQHTKLLGSLAVCANGKLFATGGEDKRVYLWSLPDAKLLGEYRGHGDFVFELAISPDGKTLASWAMDDALHVWKAAGSEPIASLEGVSGKCAFLPKAKLLLFFDTPKTLVIDPANGEILEKLPSASDAGVVGPGGKWFAMVEKKTIAIWGVK